MAPNVRWRTLGVCIALAALVFIVFGQTIRFGFVNYDDSEYVYENPTVLNGLSLPGIENAFTHIVSGHWHPLTIIVLMVSHQVFGLWPGGYHLVNVLLHAIGVILLFLMLLEMTGVFWRSAFVAAVFAIHPLRAESVAWVSECKDVLSGMFFMLTLWAYVRYVRRPKSLGRYAMVIIWLALGLMSKPMLVTTPCVLLLLDYWPLGRLRNFSQFPKLLWEKLPLFLLSALSCLAAVLALRSGTDPVSSYPASAPIAYAAYLWKLVYPVRLALLYPIPMDGFPPWEVFDSILLLGVLTAGAWLLHRKYPCLLMGWLWYLGMLVPVTGVMQTGYDAYADRYTYLPEIGLCLAGTWWVSDWAERRHFPRPMLGGIAGLVLCALLIAGWRQTTYWRNSEALWTHTLESTRDNSNAHNYLGEVLSQQGRLTQAIAEYREDLRLNPTDATAHYNLGSNLLTLGHTDEAIVQFQMALRIVPDYALAHDDLGYALFQQGRGDEAIPEFRQALRINPNFSQPHDCIGDIFFAHGRTQEAIEEYRAALGIDPTDVVAQNNLGEALLKQNILDEAILHLKAALQLQPANVEVQNHLAWVLATASQQKLRDGAKALQLAKSATSGAGSHNPNFLRTLAAAYAETGDFANAIQTAQNALQLTGASPNASLADSLRGDIRLYEAGQRIGGVH